MSRKEGCWDTSVAESFFGSLKIERVLDSVHGSREDARQDIFDYIEKFYTAANDVVLIWTISGQKSLREG